MKTMQLLLMAAPSGTQPNPLSQIIPIVLIIVVFYFFMIRPQMKKTKKQKEYVDNLKKGDKILTISGIFGKVVDKDDTTVLMETEDGSRMRILKSAISIDWVEQNQNQK